MKRFLIALAALVMIVSVGYTETVTWTNPTQYTDGVTIPAAKQAQLSTEVQYRTGATFSPFGTATLGASTFTAPYVTGAGATSYWRIRSISVADNNSTGAWSVESPFVRAYQVPGAGVIQSVQ